MALLMLFNNTDTLSFKDIRTTLEVDEGELKKNLQSLSCGKYKVLTKNPKGRDVISPTFPVTLNHFLNISPPLFSLSVRSRMAIPSHTTPRSRRR